MYFPPHSISSHRKCLRLQYAGRPVHRATGRQNREGDPTRRYPVWHENWQCAPTWSRLLPGGWSTACFELWLQIISPLRGARNIRHFFGMHLKVRHCINKDTLLCYQKKLKLDKSGTNEARKEPKMQTLFLKKRGGVRAKVHKINDVWKSLSPWLRSTPLPIGQAYPDWWSSVKLKARITMNAAGGIKQIGACATESSIFGRWQMRTGSELTSITYTQLLMMCYYLYLF